MASNMSSGLSRPFPLSARTTGESRARPSRWCAPIDRSGRGARIGALLSLWCRAAE
jgi:hypothetical protein